MAKDPITRFSIWLAVIIGLPGWFGLAFMLGPGFAIPTTIVGMVAAAVVLIGPVGKALARRLEGRTALAPPEEILVELDELRSRLVELEERMDFSERLLAQGRTEPGEARHSFDA